MTEPEETTLADRIKFIHGSLTKVEFARALGINRNTLLKYETNKGFPDFQKLQKIHKIFKVNINWLISGEGEPYIKKSKRSIVVGSRYLKIETRLSALERQVSKLDR